MQTVLLPCVSFPELCLYTTKEMEVIYASPWSVPDSAPDPIITVLPEEWKKVQRLDFQRNLCVFFFFQSLCLKWVHFKYFSTVTKWIGCKVS